VTRSPPPKPPPPSDTERGDTEPSLPPIEVTATRAPAGLPKLPRATNAPEPRGGEPTRTGSPRLPARPAPPPPRHPAPKLGPLTATPQRASQLPYARQEIVAPIDERNYTPAKLPRFTGDRAEPLPTAATLLHPAPPPQSAPPHPALQAHGTPHGMLALSRSDSARLPEVDLDLASSRLRARGTPAKEVVPAPQIRTLVYAPQPARAAWIERELSHPPITIQVGRSVSAVIAALVRDPPPRPDVLVVDFDALTPVELLELHAVRQEGWFGRLVGIGSVAPELCVSLGVDHVFVEPLVRDSLLDCVAGTNHAVVTTACPVIPNSDDHF
jgi:hypothetical protein